MPDRAVLVYANKVRALFPGVPVVLGGIEASLRRFAHYDYWDDKVRAEPSARFAGRHPRLRPGRAGGGRDRPAPGGRARPSGDRRDLRRPPGTSRRVSPKSLPPRTSPLRREAFNRAQMMFSVRTPLAQRHDTRFVLQYPAPRYTPADLDRIYGLPYSRNDPRAIFPNSGWPNSRSSPTAGVSAAVPSARWPSTRASRSFPGREESILDEIRRLVRHPDFKGYIDDLGGPTANMYGMDCDTACGKPCLDCARLDRATRRLISLMRKARAIPGVKKVFVRSGVRYDLALSSEEYIRELVGHHVSGLSEDRPGACLEKSPPVDEQGFRGGVRKIPAGVPEGRRVRPAAPQILFHGRPSRLRPRGSPGTRPGGPPPRDGRATGRSRASRSSPRRR